MPELTPAQLAVCLMSRMHQGSDSHALKRKAQSTGSVYRARLRQSLLAGVERLFPGRSKQRAATEWNYANLLLADVPGNQARRSESLLLLSRRWWEWRKAEGQVFRAASPYRSLPGNR